MPNGKIKRAIPEWERENAYEKRIGIEKDKGPDTAELFTLGLFSHIDAILDNSMENIMKKLPLSKNIKDTLLGRDNTLKDYLDLAASYQSASWEDVNLLAKKLDIDQDKLPSIYFDALGWADSIFSGDDQ